MPSTYESYNLAACTRPAKPRAVPWIFHWQSGILAPIWAALETCTVSNYAQKALVPGYSVSEAGALTNQYHINVFTPEMLARVREMALVLRWECMEQLGANVGICNVRAWRFVPGLPVGEHRDRIAPKCLKVMIFNGAVGADDGPFEYYDKGRWIASNGDWPVCIIDTQKYRHRALSPKAGRVRDVVELTVIPRIEADLPIINAGYMAGAPLDPWRAWGT